MTESLPTPLMSTMKYKKDGDFRKILNQSLNVFFQRRRERRKGNRSVYIKPNDYIV